MSCMLEGKVQRFIDRWSPTSITCWKDEEFLRDLSDVIEQAKADATDIDDEDEPLMPVGHTKIAGFVNVKLVGGGGGTPVPYYED